MNELQGTQEWRDDRCGKVTASRVDDVLTKPRKGQKDSATRNNYRAQLVCERLTGKAVEEQFQSWDMRRGMELEPRARAEYEIRREVLVDTVGFIPHPAIPRAGASPDGLVGSDGMVQFKCVKTAKHIEWMMANIVPVEHRGQMYFEMACTGRQWSDLVSYEPNLPEHLQVFIARLQRNEVEIAEIENEVRKFNAEIDEIIARLSRLDQPLESALTDSLKLVQGDTA